MDVKRKYSFQKEKNIAESMMTFVSRNRPHNQKKKLKRRIRQKLKLSIDSAFFLLLKGKDCSENRERQSSKDHNGLSIVKSQASRYTVRIGGCLLDGRGIH